jgi:hypothetical protein
MPPPTVPLSAVFTAESSVFSQAESSIFDRATETQSTQDSVFTPSQPFSQFSQPPLLLKQLMEQQDTPPPPLPEKHGKQKESRHFEFDTLHTTDLRQLTTEPAPEDLIMSGDSDFEALDSQADPMTSSAEADIEPDSQILKTQDSSGQMSLMQGVFSQASAIVQKAIGGGKKNKPGVLGVKSIQLASVAAKKVVFAYHVDQSSMLMQELQQQEEADKKAIRMKEMENRRKLAA